jgi:hypothetical protein
MHVSLRSAAYTPPLCRRFSSTAARLGLGRDRNGGYHPPGMGTSRITERSRGFAELAACCLSPPWPRSRAPRITTARRDDSGVRVRGRNNATFVSGDGSTARMASPTIAQSRWPRGAPKSASAHT